MHTNHKVANLQRRHIQAHAQSRHCHHFSHLLTRPELLSIVEQSQPDHRERHYPPTKTLSMFMSQAMSADRSCQSVVNEAAVQHVVSGLPAHSTHTGGYCKARQRLPLTMVTELVRCSAKLMDGQLPAHWRWQGRAVRLIDGTTLSMPDTQENQVAFPQQRSQKEGVGFPICRVVVVICLASGAILDANVGPCKGKGSSEQTLLRQLLGSFNVGDIVLGDAYYASYFLLSELLSRGIDGVFEQLGARKKSTDFRTGQSLGKSDHLITYQKPKKPEWMSEKDYQCAPDKLTVREWAIKYLLQHCCRPMSIQNNH